MAVGWLTVLKLVPWGDVIESAPKVAKGAQALWKSVGRKGTSDATDTDAAPLGAGDAASALAPLQAQVAQLHVAVADLHQQMRDSSALIKSLAEQNSALVQRVHLLRRALIALAVLLVGLVVVLGYSLF